MRSRRGREPRRPDPGPSPVSPIGGRVLWANGWHSCANEGGVLYCWGQNADGQIGDGTQRNANCAPRGDGNRRPGATSRRSGWGSSRPAPAAGTAPPGAGAATSRRAGHGAASATSTTPVQVPGITDCVQITGGANHTCARHADGTVSCWGSNASGQLGQLASNVDDHLHGELGRQDPVPAVAGAGSEPGERRRHRRGRAAHLRPQDRPDRRLLGRQRTRAARRRNQDGARGARRGDRPGNRRRRAGGRSVLLLRPARDGQGLVLGRQRQRPGRRRHHGRRHPPDGSGRALRRAACRAWPGSRLPRPRQRRRSGAGAATPSGSSATERTPARSRRCR